MSAELRAPVGLDTHWRGSKKMIGFAHGSHHTTLEPDLRADILRATNGANSLN